MSLQSVAKLLLAKLKLFSPWLFQASNAGYRDRLRDIVEGADLIVISTNLDGTVSTFNPAAEKALGYMASEVVGLKTPEIWHDKNEIIARADYIKTQYGINHEPGFETFVCVARNGKVDKNKWTLITKYGERIPVTLAVHGLKDKNNKIYGWVGIIQDLRAEVALEKKIQDQQVQVNQSLKLAALGEMAAGLSHEINSPLNTIILKAEQIKTRINLKVDPQELVHEVDVITKTALKIDKIIKGLRASRLDIDNPREFVKVKNIIDEAIYVTSDKINSLGIKLEIICSESIYIYCQPIHVFQVIVNLLNNAVYALSTIKEPFLSILVSESLSSVNIAVVDNGVGIPINIQDKVMLPFFTTKQSSDGTGIGLSLSSRIMKDHGGSLTFSSSSSGTVFTMQFIKTLRLKADAEKK